MSMPDERTFALMTDDADAVWRRWTRWELRVWPPEALGSFCAGIPALEQAVTERGLSAATIQAVAAEDGFQIVPDGTKDEVSQNGHEHAH